ncbi:MAG TPA: hypothetical protein VNM14_03840 [Planctomycetota bacterium]|jgi:hypothetical protein|nr:hypothetical protein [Planctomycetota bacterium]
MGREIVYCWKCAGRLQGPDFEAGNAFRVGDKVSCPDCIDELIADLSAEEQEAILHPPKPTRTSTQNLKKITSTKIKAVEKKDGGTGVRRAPTGTTAVRKTGTTGPVPRVRTGTTGPVPTASTGVRKKVTASIPKLQPPAEDDETGEGAEDGGEKPPMDEKKKRLLLVGGIGGGLFLVIVVLLILVLTKKDPPKKKHLEEASEETKPKVVAGPAESPKEKEIKGLLKAAFDLRKDQPEELGLQLKKLREAEKAADGGAMASDVTTAIDEVLAKIAKAISALDESVLPQYKSKDFKPVLEAYEKAKDRHDVPEWKEKIEAKLKLTRNNIEDAFHQIKKGIELAQQNGEDPKIDEAKATVAKWDMPEFVEKLNKFLELLSAAGTPEPTKNPDSSAKNPPPAANLRQLSPAMKSFMPMWQTAMALAFSRDYSAAATEMSGAATRADSDEAKKAASEDVENIKAIGERYPELLKSAGDTPKLQSMTLEYQDKPGEWKKVTGKTMKVEPTRLEFQPDPKDGKTPPPILIEFSDLNAGSLATLYKARKKTLPKKDADLLTMLSLIEGAVESAQGIGGTAPDRYWVHAAEAREKAPKPSSREVEARILFHQSEFEWRKTVTRYTAIEKSKQLLSDYVGTVIVRKYQPLLKERSETGKEFTFLPDKLIANGDYNTFKNVKKDDPAWVASKGIDFKDSLFNYVEAEFIALPGLSYRCWVYAGGCCQEVWNGSYQVSEQTTSNRGKQVPIDPGSQMAAPLPYPSGLKKTHDDHKPKAEKGKPPPEHPKTPAKWDWISIPLPKTFASPGAKAVRILTDQQGFGVKYIIISSSRPKPPDDATAKELAKEALAAPGGKAEIKGTPEPKDWLIIGPFPDGLTKEQPPEKEVDLTKEYPGKGGAVKWKPASPTMKGAQAHFDWEKGPFTSKDGVSVYALIHVKAPSAMDAKLWLSHDDGGRAWVNGALVHDKNKTGAAVKADEFGVAIKLEEGWNRILIKVNNAKDTFGLMMRITDPAKTAIQALEYSPYGDMLEPP